MSQGLFDRYFLPPEAVVVLAAALLVVTSAPQACAKGTPTIAKITGPGLSRPLRLSGLDFPAPVGAWRLPALTGAHNWKAMSYSTSDLVAYEERRPAGRVGPYYRIVFFEWGGTERVVQHLYPFATPDPVTFTPPGQAEAFWAVFGERETRGWWIAPKELRTFLQARGAMPPATSGSANPRECSGAKN
jgi:hypothetical protein